MRQLNAQQYAVFRALHADFIVLFKQQHMLFAASQTVSQFLLATTGYH